MTKEKALQVSIALDNVNGFEAFMSAVDSAVGEALDMCDLSSDFLFSLDNLLKEELQRRKDYLESL